MDEISKTPFYKRQIFYCSLAFIAGVLVAWGVSLLTSSSPQKDNIQDEYPLISNRVFIENPTDKIINFTALRNQIKNYVAQSVGEENINIYFEYLPTGSTFSFGDRNEFVASSLLKMPNVMSLYKAYEQGGLNLDDQVELKEEWLNSSFGDLYKKGAGYRLSLREAARLTLVESDNTAVAVVQNAVAESMKPEDEAINFLDMDYDVDNNQNVLVRADSVSSIFKCLYFSCYLKVEDSQTILNYLTQSPFDDRIVKGVHDENIKIAHKIGTRSTSSQNDCGIVYVPQRNYLICIMVNLPDPEGSEHIANISELIHDFITSLEKISSN